jgi:hypothetical protein
MTDTTTPAKTKAPKSVKGNSKKAYLARRTAGLHAANKSRRIAKAARIDKKNLDKRTLRALKPSKRRGAARAKRRAGMQQAAA